MMTMIVRGQMTMVRLEATTLISTTYLLSNPFSLPGGDVREWKMTRTKTEIADIPRSEQAPALRLQPPINSLAHRCSYPHCFAGMASVDLACVLMILSRTLCSSLSRGSQAPGRLRVA